MAEFELQCRWNLQLRCAFHTVCAFFLLIVLSDAVQSPRSNDKHAQDTVGNLRPSLSSILSHRSAAFLDTAQRGIVDTQETDQSAPGNLVTIAGIECLHQCAKSDKATVQQCVREATWPLNLSDMSLSFPTGWRLACAKSFAHASSLISQPNNGTTLITEKMHFQFTKPTWARSLRRYGEMHDCMKVSPTSYDLTNSEDASEVLSLPEQLTRQMVFKPPHGSLGNGIEVTSLNEHQKQCGCTWTHPAFWLRRLFSGSWNGAVVSCLSACGGSSLAQMYVRDPWLLGGRKFDNRAYVFVASISPMVVLMRPGFLKVSANLYDRDSTDVLTHVVKDTTEKQRFHYDELLKALVSQHGSADGHRRFQLSVDNQIAAVTQFVFANRDFLLRALCNCTHDCQECTGHGYYGVDMVGSRPAPDADVQWNIVDFNSYPEWRTPKWVSDESYYASIEATQLMFAGLERCTLRRSGLCPWATRSKHNYWTEIINEYASPDSERIMASTRCSKPLSKTEYYEQFDHFSSGKMTVGIDQGADMHALKGVQHNRTRRSLLAA